MRKSIQIRNVPETLHRRLKARAALEGVSMSRYVLREIERALAHPGRREWLESIGSGPEAVLDRSPADILREERPLHRWSDAPGAAGNRTENPTVTGSVLSWKSV